MDKPVAYGSFYVAYQCGFFTNQCFYTMICKLSEKLHLEKKVRYQKCTRIIGGANTWKFAKSWEVWYIMYVSTLYTWTKCNSLQKLPFAPKAPVCTKSSRLHKCTLQNVLRVSPNAPKVLICTKSSQLFSLYFSFFSANYSFLF